MRRCTSPLGQAGSVPLLVDACEPRPRVGSRRSASTRSGHPFTSSWRGSLRSSAGRMVPSAPTAPRSRFNRTAATPRPNSTTASAWSAGRCRPPGRRGRSAGRHSRFGGTASEPDAATSTRFPDRSSRRRPRGTWARRRASGVGVPPTGFAPAVHSSAAGSIRASPPTRSQQQDGSGTGPVHPPAPVFPGTMSIIRAASGHDRFSPGPRWSTGPVAQS